MTLSKETQMGTISISNSILAQIIFDGMRTPACVEKIWPATPRGRQIGMVHKYMDTEFSMYIETEKGEDGRFILEFSVIAKFGISIGRTTQTLSDYIARDMKEIIGENPKQITINIAGIKSRNKVRGKTKVVYKYEA